VNANSWQDPRARGDEWTTCDSDRPVLCQFASHDPEVLVKVVQDVSHECDGVDLNLGCPQGIARRGRYGSWLQDEWQLIYDMVSAVAQRCSVPITVKIRVFDDHDRTLQVPRCTLRRLVVHGFGNSACCTECIV
jgi:tRNA-dihydrouridine synthase 1